MTRIVLGRTLVNIGMSLPFPAIGPTVRDRSGHRVDQPTPRPGHRATFSHEAHFQPDMKSSVCPLYSGQTPTNGRLWTMGEAPNGPVMRACQAHATRGRSPRQRDSRDRLIGLRLAANTVRAVPTPSPGQRRVDQSLRARQRDHLDAQSAALGTWQHASADNLKDSFACRCYGCTGAGRLFARKSSRGGFLRAQVSTPDTWRRRWLGAL